MAKKYDVVAVTGEYQDREGQTKKRYQNCGACFEKDGRLSIKLEAIPVSPEWNGWLNLFEPRSSGGRTSTQGSHAPAGSSAGSGAQSSSTEFDDDIPF